MNLTDRLDQANPQPLADSSCGDAENTRQIRNRVEGANGVVLLSQPEAVKELLLG